jgi:hypothetical protein
VTLLFNGASVASIPTRGRYGTIVVTQVATDVWVGVVSGGGAAATPVPPVLLAAASQDNAGNAGPINTSGASLIVAALAGYGAPIAFVDSMSNSWTRLTNYLASGYCVQFAYTSTPITS